MIVEPFHGEKYNGLLQLLGKDENNKVKVQI